VNKHRHILLTFLLMLIVSVNATVYYLHLSGDLNFAELNELPIWAFYYIANLPLLNIICAVALLLWKKWGFWGFVITTILEVLIYILLGLGIEKALPAIISLFVIYTFLNIGKDKNAWSKLS